MRPRKHHEVDATKPPVGAPIDPNGNLTNDGSRTLTWNARNQLASLTGAASGSFGYDGLGRRRTKTVAGVSTGFLYDGLNPVQEVAGSLPAANLLTGLGIDEYLMRTDTAGARHFLTDALGSTLGLADGAGTVQTEYTYEPFGQTTPAGTPTGNTFAFTGRETDGTGLMYYRARYHDPRLQRFVREDPLGAAGGVNPFAYAANRPTMLVDPFGLKPKPGLGPGNPSFARVPSPSSGSVPPSDGARPGLPTAPETPYRSNNLSGPPLGFTRDEAWKPLFKKADPKAPPFDGRKPPKKCPGED